MSKSGDCGYLCDTQFVFTLLNKIFKPYQHLISLGMTPEH